MEKEKSSNVYWLSIGARTKKHPCLQEWTRHPVFVSLKSKMLWKQKGYFSFLFLHTNFFVYFWQFCSWLIWWQNQTEAPDFVFFFFLISCLIAEIIMYRLDGCACVLSHFSWVWLFATLWTIACQTPLWDSLGKNTGVGCHSFLQGIFLTQGWNLGSPALQSDSLSSDNQRSPRMGLLLLLLSRFSHVRLCATP